MIRLFLANQEVELNESVSFAITKQFEDITSPTDIKNDYSKTVNIPFSQSNNKLFGMLFSPDKLTVEGGITGLYFDPYKKIDFRLQWGDAILLQGYAKVKTIVQEKNSGYYEITLNGELGKVFQEMKKITFDKNINEVRYLIDGGKYVHAEINRDLVKECFENKQENLTLLENTDPSYKITDIIGFAPNIAKTDDFKHSEFQNTINNTITFETDLNSIGEEREDGSSYFTYSTGFEPSTVLKDGLNPRQFGEFRSYLQLPFIYFNKLFQIFINKAKELTGYNFDLNSKWFNEYNPYWSKLVLMLSSLFEEGSIPALESKIGTQNKQNTYFSEYDNDATSRNFSNVWGWYLIDGYDMFYTVDFANEKNLYIQHNVEYTIDVDAKKLRIYFNAGDALACRLNPVQTLFIDLSFTNRFTQVVDSVPLYAIVDKSSTLKYNDYEMIKIDGFSIELNEEGQKIFVYDIDLPQISRKHIFTKYGENVACRMNFTIRQLDQKNNYKNNRFIITNSYGNEGYANPYTSFRLNVDSEEQVIRFTFQPQITQSEFNFTLNSMWNKEYNLFDVILNYCKMHRLLFITDDINKVITITPAVEYFKDYKILDWTNKLDLSKSKSITPVSFENKYILFNYKSANGKLYKEYKDTHGVNYGEYKLKTNYEFNDEEKKLFGDIITPSLVYTPNILPYNSLLNCKVEYYLSNEIYVYCEDDNGKYKSPFGKLFFHNGNREFDPELGKVYISDDTPLEKSTGISLYSGLAEWKTQVNKYPYLDVVSEFNNVLYVRPMMNYTYDVKSQEYSVGLYDNFWKEYLDERYNKQNKLVTCYLKLSLEDFMNFKYNNFIQIENQLYMVNKIYDYQIDENESTKVDLITIQNIKGYTINGFIPDKVFEVYSRNGDVWDDEDGYIGLSSNTSNLDSYRIYVTSSSPVTVEYVTNNLSDVDVVVDGKALMDGERFREGKKVPVIFQLTAPVETRVEGKIRLTNEYGQSKTFDVIIVELM